MYKQLLSKIAVVSCLLMWSLGIAQTNTQLFQFALKENQQLLTVVDDSLSLSSPHTLKNKLNQAFIIKQTAQGYCYVVPAANSSLFLKREGNGVSLVMFDENDEDQRWKILYTGHPYASLVDPTLEVFLSWDDVAGIILENSPSSLSSNDDTAGNHFRFSIEKIEQTF